MFQLHQTEVDGVRCFWVETGRPTLAAALTFRAGMADEPLPRSGWLHLLEHLSLHGRGGGALHVNGSVSLLHTTFDAHGPVDSVAAHLADVTAWLTEPTFDELDRERGVLRAEATLRGGPGNRLFAWRYGARGPGVIGYEEPGLGLATPELLRRRSHEVFTRGNAALVLDGPPPAELRLTLPDGDLIQPTAAVPCDDQLPAAYVDAAGVVLSGQVSRSATATVAQEILQRALQERLRDRAGAAYAPWAAYEPVDAERALLFGMSDVSPSLYPTLADSILDLVAKLREQPVPGDWLDEVIEARHQAMRDPYSAVALAGRAAHYHLMGKEPQTHDEVVAELLATTNDGVRETLREFAASLLLGVPGEASWHDQLPMLAFPTSRPRHTGRRFRSVNWPGAPERLLIADDLVQIAVKDEARSIPFAAAAGLLQFEDGGRHVVSIDGWGLTVEPTAWRNGDAAIRQLDERVATRLHLPMPARPGHEPATRAGLPLRWWRGLQRAWREWLGFAAMVAGVIVLSVAAFVFLIRTHVTFAAVMVLVACFHVLRALNQQRRESSSSG